MFFLAFFGWVLLKDGYAVDATTGAIVMEPMKYLHNYLSMPLLLVLTVAAWPRLKALPTLLRRNPYLVFAVVYALAFILAFSGFANFGILARQRVLMVPFFLVLLARRLRSISVSSTPRSPGWWSSAGCS